MPEMGGEAAPATVRTGRRSTWIRVTAAIAAVVFIVVIIVGFDAVMALAQDDELEGVTRLEEIMNRIKTWIQTLAITFAVVMVCVAGVRYLASSDPTGSEKAKNALKAAAIGLGIVLLAGPLVSILTWFIQGG